MSKNRRIPPLQSPDPYFAIAKEVAAKVTQIFPEEVFGPSQIRENKWARHIASRLMRLQGFSQTKVAQHAGRTLPTISNSYRRFCQLYREDAEFRKAFDKARQLSEEAIHRAQIGR